jgi:hypothetical protein
MGGLGNQLFQIFATLAYAVQNQYTCVFPYFVWFDKKRHTYWDSFLLELKKYTTSNTELGITNNDITNFNVYREPHFHYNPITSMNTNFLISGYFQSYMYFDNVADKLFSMIALREKQSIIKEKYEYLFTDSSITRISMHFRIGDYKNLQNYHNILPYQYYQNALEKIVSQLTKPTKINVLYFCEECDNLEVNQHIEKLKLFFNNIEIEFVKIQDKIEDWEQLLLMSVCDHNIIANSTYSWWGAYFNTNSNKMVCYPKVWFGPSNSHHNLMYLFPPSWNCISS